MVTREMVVSPGGGSAMPARVVSQLVRCGSLWIGALAILGVACGAAPAAWAAINAGEAVIVVSKVRGTLGVETREIAIRDNVFSQEVIETGPDAATRLVFLDGSELSIGPSSRVTLDEYIYDPGNKGAGRLSVNLLSGVFQFASGDIPANGYDLRTPFATIAVRGTLVEIDIEQGVVHVKEGVGEVGGITIEAGRCYRQGDLFSPEECEALLGRVLAMLTLLEIAPGAGPIVTEVPIGPDNDGNDDNLGALGSFVGGASPR
jgi:hypothetical protein